MAANIWVNDPGDVAGAIGADSAVGAALGAGVSIVENTCVNDGDGSVAGGALGTDTMGELNACVA